MNRMPPFHAGSVINEVRVTNRIKRRVCHATSTRKKTNKGSIESSLT
jgi:hypothetical protein